jgi:hypothetical protein
MTRRQLCEEHSLPVPCEECAKEDWRMALFISVPVLILVLLFLGSLAFAWRK